MATVRTSKPRINDENVMRSSGRVVSTAACTNELLVHSYITSNKGFLRQAARTLSNESIASLASLSIALF